MIERRPGTLAALVLIAAAGTAACARSADPAGATPEQFAAAASLTLRVEGMT